MACVWEPCQMNVSDVLWSSTQERETNCSNSSSHNVIETLTEHFWNFSSGISNSCLPRSIKKMLFVTFSVQNCNFCPHFPQQSEELPLNKFILLEFEFFRSWIQDILLTVRFFSLAWSPLLVAIVLDHLFVWQLWVLELLLLHSGHQFYFSVCLLPLGAVIEKHSLSLHLYADDIQIYLLLKGFSIIEAIVIQPSSRPRHQLTFQNLLHSFTVTQALLVAPKSRPTHPEDWASLWSKCASWPFTN